MRDKVLRTQPLSLVEKLDSRLLLRVLSDFRKGDFSVRLPADNIGVAGKVYDTINEIIELNSRLTRELERISTFVGKEGKIRHRATLTGATGGWADSIDSVNSLVGDLIQPITDVSRVIGAVAKGDLSQTMELLKQSQSLATELQSRQFELTETNSQLQQQARTLQESEERLKSQQEELQQTNEELEEKARLLFQQNKEVERKNAEIEKARAALEEKAAQLALTSRYKSEFLANMSHELRTPMNSMLILSRILSENEEGNLNPKQVEYAQTIHSSGDDLLALINEILDLSKIESGTMDVENKRVLTADIREYVEKNFGAVAQSKGLQFSVNVRPNAPKALCTDQQRLQQILKNLLANAFKFTHEGNVILRIELSSGGWSAGHKLLDRADQVIAFSVIDTGIGISADKHCIIFEAFQQADGTTSRKYGGTGLGLSISREIANLLGGEIRVASTPGEGSMFTLFLPRESTLPVEEVRREPASGDPAVAVPSQLLPSTSPHSLPVAEETICDDRDNIGAGDRVLMIVESNPKTAEGLLKIGRGAGFKGITSRFENAIALAREFSPDAIILRPDNHGWSVLDRLKRDLATRHIPVQIISGKKERQRALNLGAFAFLEAGASVEAVANSLESIKEFLDRAVKNVLVVEDNETQRKSILDLIGNGDVKTVAVSSGEEALAELHSAHFDCMVIDLGLTDMSGFDLLERLKKEMGLNDLPVIVYTGKDLSHKEQTRLRKLAETIIIKNARSPERLFAETSLFLHRAPEALPDAKRRMLEQEQRADPLLAGKKVLVIDDDVRNIFSLTSLLERHYMEVLFAENGRDGIELLMSTSGVDAILVDVMMPEMDGYETMRKIRKLRRFKSIPMIALTAKAMNRDREKCIEAGASDYISKPADVDRLLSLLRVYLVQ